MDERAARQTASETQWLEVVRRSLLFSDVPDEDFNLLAPHFSLREVVQGERLWPLGAPATIVYFVLKGEVRTWIRSGNGREVTLRISGPGRYVGASSILAGGGSRVANTIASLDSLLCRLDGQIFLDAARARPALAFALAKTINDLAFDDAARIFEYSALETRYRLYSELVRLARVQSPPDGPFKILNAPTHLAIALSIAAAREAVTRELNSLQRHGLITMKRQMIQIQDIGYLENAVQQRAGAAATALIRHRWHRE